MNNLPSKIRFTENGEAWVIDPEDMLPKYAGNPVLNRVAESFNQLIQYLGDREEASKGECQHIYKRINGNGIESSNYCLKCNIHPKPHNPPEHDEMEKDDDIALYRAVVARNFNYVKGYIQANFVSKDKIREYCNEQIEAFDIASDYDSGVRNALNRLKESLGINL